MRAANATHSKAVPTIFLHVAFICVFIAFIVLLRNYCCMRCAAYDPSSATRPARALDCNKSAMAGFAAAPGRVTVANSNLPRAERPRSSATTRCGQQAEPSRRCSRAELDLSAHRVTESSQAHPNSGRAWQLGSECERPQSGIAHPGWRICDIPPRPNAAKHEDRKQRTRPR